MEKVIIFGRGKFFRENEHELKRRYEIAGFLDNNVREDIEMECYQNLPICNPAQVSNYGKYPIILMVKHFVELFYQLMELKVDANRILFGILLFPETEKERLVSEQGQLKGEHGKLVYYGTNGNKSVILNQHDMKELLLRLVRDKLHKENKAIPSVANLPLAPISRDFGTGRGKAIDRYYIEDFLRTYKEDIRGNVLEIAENIYTIKYGENRVEASNILHVNGWGNNAIKGNLETGEGLAENEYDTLIITQTLMFIYDLKSVADNIYRTMKNNGTALITVAGISQISRYDADNWGSYWGLHEDALKRLFVPLFGEENVLIKIYGNVKTATAMLYGLCCEELCEEDFNVQDADYPVILAVRLKKSLENLRRV